MNSSSLAAHLDSTNLRPDATAANLRLLCEDARRCAFAAVMIYPASIPFARGILAGCDVRIGTVIGFPHGRDATAAKEAGVRTAAEMGAHEVDIVMNYAGLREGNPQPVAEEISRLAGLARGMKLVTKIIVEACYLDRAQKLAALRICEDAGVDFIKTSTGFGAGGATLDDVKLWAGHRRGAIRIKAAGGIKTVPQARAFIAAGAERLGTSHAVSLLREETGGGPTVASEGY